MENILKWLMSMPDSIIIIKGHLANSIEMLFLNEQLTYYKICSLLQNKDIDRIKMQFEGYSVWIHSLQRSFELPLSHFTRELRKAPCFSDGELSIHAA
jgi:hypothetical protein